MKDNRISEALDVITNLLKKENNIDEDLGNYWSEKDNCTVCHKNWWEHDETCIIGQFKKLEDIICDLKEN
jgi:hypothetical protein